MLGVVFLLFGVLHFSQAQRPPPTYPGDPDEAQILLDLANSYKSIRDIWFKDSPQAGESTTPTLEAIRRRIGWTCEPENAKMVSAHTVFGINHRPQYYNRQAYYPWGPFDQPPTTRIGWQLPRDGVCRVEELIIPESGYADFTANKVLTGPFPKNLHKLTYLKILDFAGADFTGTIPTHIFPSLKDFFFSGNKLNGTIPFIWKEGSIQRIRLHDNQLSGRLFPLPRSLIELDLGNNRLVDTLDTLLKPTDGPFLLQRLSLGMNNLFGTLPTKLEALTSLTYLSLFTNKFSGTFPTSIGNLSQLEYLNIQQNSLTGTFPYQVPNDRWKMRFFQISQNFFEGEMNTTKLFDKKNSYPLGSSEVRGQFRHFDFSVNRFLNQGSPIYPSDSAIEYSIAWHPQDVDECALETHSCPKDSACVDGWNPVLSYTCKCIPGYSMSVDQSGVSSCIDINECITGAWSSPLNGTLKPCSKGTYCQNTLGGYACPSCETIGELTIDPQKSYAFTSLLNYTQSFNHHTCFGACESGIRIVRFPDMAATCSSDLNMTSLMCSYPCTNKSAFNTETSAIATLWDELQRGDFLKDVIFQIWNASVSFSRKRANAMMLSISPCPSDHTKLQSLLSSLAKEIVPNAPNLKTSVDSNCQTTFSAQDPNSTAMIVGIVVGLVAALVILFMLIMLRYYLQSEVSYLPPEVAWSYKHYKRNPLGWEYRGSKGSGYYYRDLEEGDEMYAKALELFKTFETSNSDSYEVSAIAAVYNPVLVRNFVGNYQIAVGRSSQEIFNSKRWQEDEDQKQREFVHEHYRKTCERYEWNKKQHEISAIIPMLHGTDLLVAEKICESGFCALSSIDAGYFGKGIYFTNFMLYTLPYIAQRSKPALILSWIVPGNVYPVIEQHDGPKSLIGSAIKSGYGSHYVLTTSQGDCLQKQQTQFCDELVVSQESQIAPAYIFEISRGNLKKLMKDWSRPVPQQVDSPTIVF